MLKARLLLLFSGLLLVAGDTLADVTVSSEQFMLTLYPDGTSKLHHADFDLSVNATSTWQNEKWRWEIALTTGADEGLDPPAIEFGADIEASRDERGGVGRLFYDYQIPFAQKNNGEVVSEPSQSELLESSLFGWYTETAFEAIRTRSSDVIPTFADETFGRYVLKSSEAGRKSTAGIKTLIVSFDYLSGERSKEALYDHSLDGLLFVDRWEWFRQLCLIIWSLMNWVYGYCGSWGVTIVLVAFLMRIATIPVTRFSLQQQQIAIAQRDAMAPILAEIKKTQRGVEQSRMVVAAYETHNYQHMAPLKSMLGLLVQIPILVAMFNVLTEMADLRGTPFLWFDDLARSDRAVDSGVDVYFFGGYINFLPFLLGAVTCLSSGLISPKPQASGKRHIVSTYGLGVLFFVLFYSFPSALVVYWPASNALQLAYQVVIDRGGEIGEEPG